MTQPLSILRIAAAVGVATVSVVPTALVLELAGHLFVTLLPQAGSPLPLFSSYPMMAPTSPTAVRALAFGFILTLLAVGALLYVFCLGVPLLLLAQKLRVRSSLVFGLLAGVPAAALELTCRQPLTRDALWLALLMSTACFALHRTATHPWRPPATRISAASRTPDA